MPDGPIVLPRLGAQSADCHAHLGMLDDPAGALERAAMAGTMFIVTVDDPTDGPSGSLDRVGGWRDETDTRLRDWEIEHGEAPEVRVITGVHPHEARHFTAETGALIESRLSHPLAAGIGEIGLDYHYDHSPREDQLTVFRTQLEMARRLDVPAVIHLREAHDDGLEVMRDVGLPDAGCVLHCFTGGPELVEPFLEIGCHISFAGPVTFRRATAVRAALNEVPLDKVLFETDCPFMAPEPLRGRTNEPAWVTLTIAAAAEVRGEPVEILSLSALGTARRLFGGAADA